MNTQWKLNERDVYEARLDHGADENGPLFMLAWIEPVTRTDGSVWYSVSYRFSDQDTISRVDFLKPKTFLEAASRLMDHAERWMSEHFFRA